jgi:ankyrin repeat protein
VVDYLVDKMEYDVNQPSSDGKTALQYAIENNHLAVVKVLLELYATVSEQERKALAEIDNAEIQEFHQQPRGILPNLKFT